MLVFTAFVTIVDLSPGNPRLSSTRLYIDIVRERGRFSAECPGGQATKRSHRRRGARRFNKCARPYSSRERAEPIELICEFIRDAEVSSHSMKVKLSPVHRAARPSLVTWRARSALYDADSRGQMSSFLSFPSPSTPSARFDKQCRLNSIVAVERQRGFT